MIDDNEGGRKRDLSRRNILLAGTAIATGSVIGTAAAAQTPEARKATPAPGSKKPNILVIFGDDIGQSDISAYTFGLMGYRTPNIDRIAKEGMMFTDYYAEQSCTAGRSSFITGQSVLRTGLSKVGISGCDCRSTTGRYHARRSTEAARLRHRGSSAKTTWGTATNICPRFTASTSSSATSIISMPRRNRKTPTIRRTPRSRPSSVHAA